MMQRAPGIKDTNETLFHHRNGHVLTACPFLLKYWTCTIVLN